MVVPVATSTAKAAVRPSESDGAVSALVSLSSSGGAAAVAVQPLFEDRRAKEQGRAGPRAA